MPVFREKEYSSRDSKPLREASTSRKPKRDESLSRKPIITQEKPPKLKHSTSSKIKDRPTVEKLLKEDGLKKTTERGRKPVKPDGETLKSKRHESSGPKNKREINDLEMKIMKKMEAVEKSVRRREESKRSEKDESKRKEERKKSQRDRTRTRTLSPTEVKQLVPGRMGYELAGGDAGRIESREEKRRKEEKGVSGSEETDNDYEEDFEDYESDFEVDEEQEDEPEIPSSPEKEPSEPVVQVQEEVQEPLQPSPEKDDRWRLSAKKREIETVKRSVERENYELANRRKSAHKIEEDDSDKENRFKRNQKNEQIVDFSRALRRQKKEKEAEASRKRGEQLLGMITLDAISYSIFEIPPIPYEEFMKAFGKSNTKQVSMRRETGEPSIVDVSRAMKTQRSEGRNHDSKKFENLLAPDLTHDGTHKVYVQTNEDNLEEEVQTDEIADCNKWTQHPPEYLPSRENEPLKYVLTKEERLGVGEDAMVGEEVVMRSRTTGLWSFLSWACQVMLLALESRSGGFVSWDSTPNHSKAIPFGDGFVQLNISGIPFLKGKSVSHLCHLPGNGNKFLSVHINKDKIFQKSIICLWSFLELSKPLKILIASNRVTSCCFTLSKSNLVFAGLSDGSVCVWDLREHSVLHNKVTSGAEWTLQSSTYTTAGSWKEGHSNAVVSVQVIQELEEGNGFEDLAPMQICSLDKHGFLIIWSVVQVRNPHKNTPLEDVGLANWGRVKLVKSSSFSIFASLKDEIPGLYISCNDMLINKVEEDGFYVANSFGSVHHCSFYGSPIKPKFYVPGKQDSVIETTCLELCPFNGNYFLVGCGDGTIRLHSRHQENPLICLNPNLGGDEKEAAVVSLTWMQTRPCVFFALDSRSRIHIWDLGISDMYPEVSLTLTEKKISCMKLLSHYDPRQAPFIVLGTDTGKIEIHKLKPEYGLRPANEVKNEVKMFLKYVSIL